MFFEYSISFPYMMTVFQCPFAGWLTRPVAGPAPKSTDRKIDFGVCPIIDLQGHPSVRPWSVNEMTFLNCYIKLIVSTHRLIPTRSSQWACWTSFSLPEAKSRLKTAKTWPYIFNHCFTFFCMLLCFKGNLLDFFLFYFTAACVKCRLVAVKRLSVIHHSADCILISFRIMELVLKS